MLHVTTRSQLKGRHLWVRLHRWLGLVAACWLVLLGLSGSLLAFYPEIDRALNPDWATPQASGPDAPMQQVLDRARAAMPDRFLHSVFPANGPQDVHHVWFTPSAQDQGRMWEVLVDPVTTDVLGQREAVPTLGLSRRDLVNTVYTLHYNLLLGEAGSTLAGFVGLAALLSAISGLVLWWPRGGRTWRAQLGFKPGAAGVRRHFDLHRAAGSYGWLPLVVVLFTGVTLTFPTQTEWLLGLGSGSAPPAPPGLPAGPLDPRVDADAVLARAVAHFPAARVRCLWLPQAAGPAWLVTLVEPQGVGLAGGRGELWVHPFDGSVLALHRHADASPVQAYQSWELPLHNGSALGLPGRLLVCVLGLLPLCLAVTGLVIWWHKRRGRLAAKTVARTRGAG